MDDFTPGVACPWQQQFYIGNNDRPLGLLLFECRVHSSVRREHNGIQMSKHHSEQSSRTEGAYRETIRVPALFGVQKATFTSLGLAVHDGDDKMTLKVLYPDGKRTCNNCVPLGQLIIRSG